MNLWPSDITLKATHQATAQQAAAIDHLRSEVARGAVADASLDGRLDDLSLRVARLEARVAVYAGLGALLGGGVVTLVLRMLG